MREIKLVADIKEMLLSQEDMDPGVRGVVFYKLDKLNTKFLEMKDELNVGSDEEIYKSIFNHSKGA